MAQDWEFETTIWDEMEQVSPPVPEAVNAFRFRRRPATRAWVAAGLVLGLAVVLELGLGLGLLQGHDHAQVAASSVWRSCIGPSSASVSKDAPERHWISPSSHPSWVEDSSRTPRDVRELLAATARLDHSS
jgi:hypothetical protein